MVVTDPSSSCSKCSCQGGHIRIKRLWLKRTRMAWLMLELKKEKNIIWCSPLSMSSSSLGNHPDWLSYCDWFSAADTWLHTSSSGGSATRIQYVQTKPLSFRISTMRNSWVFGYMGPRYATDPNWATAIEMHQSRRYERNACELIGGLTITTNTCIPLCMCLLITVYEQLGFHCQSISIAMA